jgi:hypothetical protein
VVPEADGFALNQERETSLERAGARALVLAEQPFLVPDIDGRVESPPELRHVRERRFEPLAGAAEGRGLLLGDLGVAPPVRVLKPRHRKRPTASV